MAIQLVLHRSTPAPSAQVRIVWQGFLRGDSAEALWGDMQGDQRWSGVSPLAWLQRDALRPGEEWKLDLDATPAEVTRIVLRITSSSARTIGVSVAPLVGSPNDAVLHPGAELAAGRTSEVLELTRAEDRWLLTAINTMFERESDVVPERARPIPTPDPPAAPRAGQPSTPRTQSQESAADRRSGQHAGSPAQPVEKPGTEWQRSAPVPDWVAGGGTNQGTKIPIPANLQPAVDSARGAGKIRSRPRVDVVVDTSASMRPWLVSGQLATVLTAVQALAGASSRPGVSTRFLPDVPGLSGSIELNLDADAAGAITERLVSAGLRTGDRRNVVLAAQQASSREGLHILITDDASLACELGKGTVTVLFGEPTPKEALNWVVPVPPGPSDVRVIARQLAVAAATPDSGSR